MTSYNEIFKKAFSDAQPSIPNDMALRKILERSRIKTRRFPKKAAAILIAAAVLLIGGVGAAAASGWDLAGAFTRLFALRSQGTNEFITSIKPASIGKELDKTFELLKLASTDSRGAVSDYREIEYTLSLNGIIAEKNAAYMLFDLALDEEWMSQFSEDYIWTAEISCEVNGSSAGIECTEISTADNTISLYCYAGFDDAMDLDGKTLKYTFECFRGYPQDGGHTAFIDCSETIEIPIDFGIYNESRTILLDHPLKLGNGDIMLESITLKAFSMNYTLRIAESSGLSLDDRSLRLKLNKIADGILLNTENNSITCSGGTTTLTDDYTYSGTLLLNAPSAVDMITSITIEDTNISLDNGDF